MEKMEFSVFEYIFLKICMYFKSMDDLNEL